MVNMKLKGIVLDETFRNIIHNATKNTVNSVSGEVTYWTTKSVFLAKKKGIRYWEIYQIRGLNEGMG
jgi:hypothetical protein